MDFKDKIKATGHVEIIKINHLTNVSSVVYEDPNVITGGLGRSIAQFMSTSGCVIDPCPTESQQFGPRNSIIQPGGGEENSLKGENRGGRRAFASKMAEQESEGEAEDCCIGLLEMNIHIYFKEIGDETQIGWDAIIQVDTVTVCEDIACNPGFFGGDPCGDKVADFNKKQKEKDRKAATGTEYEYNNWAAIATDYNHWLYGTGRTRAPTRDALTTVIKRATKLGCCNYPCPEKRGSKKHKHSGTTLNDAAGAWQKFDSDGNPYLDADGNQRSRWNPTIHGFVASAEGGWDATVNKILAEFGFGGSTEEPSFKPCCTTKKEVS